MTRTLWARARVVAPAVTLAVLVSRLGTGPFLQGLRSVNWGVLAAAALLAVPTTVCCAWRWKIVACRLGVDLPLRGAVAAYYRSLFLNVTLPGGVVGDIHRGISHGRDVSDVNRALRSVAWERFAGQVVQVLVTVVVLLLLPSPVHALMPLVAIAVLVTVLAIVLGARRRTEQGPRSHWRRLVSTAASDIRDGLLTRSGWPRIALASALVVAGHAVTFLIAARAAGAEAPVSRMLPIALIVMAAMVLPSIGGWGPREGVAAWCFGAAGLGPQRGVATGVVYGVMVFVASLPGAVVLIVAFFRRIQRPGRAQPRLRQRPARV